MYSENSVPADPLDASYVAIVTEWLGGGLPSTDHHVTLNVHGVCSREASDRRSSEFEEKSDIIWRNPIGRHTYLLTQLDDLSNNNNNNNNNKISAPYEWTDGYKGLSQNDETKDEQSAKNVVGNSAGGAVGARDILIDDVTSDESHDVIEDGFVLIDGFSWPKEIAVSGKYLPGSEEIHREEIFLNSLFVNGRTQNQSDDSRFESETELERDHFWKNKADVKKPSSKSESFSVSLSKEPHHKVVADHSMVTSPSITSYEDDMKLFFQTNDPSIDHFHLFTASGGMENESGKSTSTKQVSSYRFPVKPNIQKRLLIQVNNPDWEFPTLSTHKHDDSKYSSILSRDNNLPEEISTTGFHSANKTPDVSITTTASASTSAHSIHIPGNVQIKAKPEPTAFESMVAEELTNIFESGKKEVEKELGIPDFEFSETKSKKETKMGNEGHTSEKESETSQMEKTQNVFLPDFDFDDTAILGTKTKPYEKGHSTTLGKTKTKVETPTTPAKNIKTSVKEHSKVGVGDQENIELPSFGFMNLSGEVPGVSSVFSSTSTLTTTHKSETTDFGNLANIIAGKQDIGLQLHGQDHTAKVQTSEVSEKVKGEIQDGKAGKGSDTTQMEILRNIALPDFDFDEDLKTNKTEEHFQSKPVTWKPTAEVKTKGESAENPSMTNTTTQITQIKMEGRDGQGKDKEKVKKKIEENIELPNFGFEDLPASSASSSISAFEKMLTQELTSVIESGKKEAAKQMEIPDFTFDLQESNVNQKVTKDHASERISDATEIEKMAEINLPDFEFDETIAAATTATINKGKDRHVTSEAQTIKTRSLEKEKLTKEGKLENLEKTTQGHVIIPSFDFENLSSREATSSFSSSMTFSSAKSKAQKAGDNLESHKDEVLEEHAELAGKEFKSPLVTTQVSLKSVDGKKVHKRSESPERGTDENSVVSTQITTSIITISKAPQSPEKSHPKTSIKLISRAESYEKSKEATTEAKDKNQDLQNIAFDYQGSSKQAEDGKRSVDDSNKFQLPTFGLDSHLPGQDKMYSIVADEKIVIERDSKPGRKPTKVSESTPETGNFTVIPFFKLRSNEDDDELETEITNTETPSDIPRETATEKNIKIEFPTFGYDSITTHADTFDGGANEAKEDETAEIPDNHDKNETMLMQTGTEIKFGSKALPDESILNAGTIESYVEKIMESAVNSIKHMDLIEKRGKKSHVDDEDDDEREEDIEVPYSKLKDEDEDDDEEDKMKLFKKSIDTDGLGNIIGHKEGGEGTKQRVDDDYDFDEKSGKVHLPGGDDDGQEYLVDVTRSSSERLRNLTRDLVVERPALTSTSSVEIVITPATPVDRRVAISDDWYGKLNETSLIEEEKMEEKRARQMADEMQKSSDDFVPDYEAEDEDDDDDTDRRKNVLTYDDDDMKIYDVDNADDDDDDDDDDSNTDDDLSGPFSNYKREVIRISFDDDESGDDGRKASTSSSEDRINPGLYSPKKRFSLENIETIKEENEGAHMEDPFSPSDHETVTPGIFGATLEKDASGLISVSLPRFQMGEVELENVVSKVSESAGPASITTSIDVAVTTPTSETTIATSSRERTAETSLPTHDTSLHSFNLTDQKQATPLEQNIIISATPTAATTVAVTEATPKTSSEQQNDLDVLIPVAENVRPSEKIYPSTDHSGMNKNLPRVDLHSTSSTKTSTPTAPTSSATVAEEASFSTAVSSKNVVVAHDVTTTSTSSTADVREIGGRIVAGSLLSTFDIEAIPDSSVPAENWSGNTETTEREIKLEQKDISTFEDDLDVEDKIKIPFFDIDSRTTFSTSDSNSLEVNEDNQESEKTVKIEIPFFDIGHDLTNTVSDLPIAEVKGQRKGVTSFPSDADASPITTAEVYIPATSGSKNVDNTLTTTSASSAEEAIDIGERLLLGSLLSTVDVKIIPASPVPPSVMEDENWFGNTDVNEKETAAFNDDKIFHDVDTSIKGDINMEIPFFDIGQDLSGASSDLRISKSEGQGKDVTSFPLDESSALDISKQYFSVSTSKESTTGFVATTTTSAAQPSHSTLSNEGISLPRLSPLTSGGQNVRMSENATAFEDQEPGHNPLSDREGNLSLITSSSSTTKPSSVKTLTTAAVKIAPTEVQVSTASYASVPSSAVNVTSSDLTTAQVSSEADAKEIGVRVLAGSLLSFADVDIVPVSSVQPSVTEDANWSGNTESKVSYQDIFDDSLDDDKDYEERTDRKETENVINMVVPFFDTEREMSTASDRAISQMEGHVKVVTSFPADASSFTTTETNIPTTSGNTNENTFSTTSTSPAEAIDIGERLLLGSLLSTVDVKIIPASPVPPSVVEDENWFGNTDVNEKETNLEQQDFGALDDDIEIEENIPVPFFETERSNNIAEGKIGFGQIEIPFFDIEGDLSNDLSEVEVKDKIKLVTQSSVQTTSSSAKALDISTQFFNVSASTDPFPTTLTTSSIEGISPPTVSSLISGDQRASTKSSKHDHQEHLDETLRHKGITDATGKEDEISVTDQDDVQLRSGVLKRKRSNVKGEPADGEDDDDEEFMTKRSSSSIVKSYNTRIIDAPREYNDSYVAESDEDDIREDIQDFDVGKVTIGHSIEAPEFSQEKQFKGLDLKQEGDGKEKLQELSTFGFEFKSKVITSGEEFPKSQTNESEAYDESIRRLDSLLERSRRELGVLRPGADKKETTDEDGKPHHASKEEEHFLLDTTLDRSLAEFRDVSSVMSPGSDVTEDSPSIGWRSTGKVHQVPLDSLLDSSALESPVRAGEVKVGRRALDDNWLDTSTETSESMDKFELLPDQIPIRGEEKLTHLSGPIRKKDNVPVDSRMTDGSSMHKSITPTSSSSSPTVTLAKPSSEIDWSIKDRQSNENKVEHRETSKQASSSPSSIRKVTATTTRVMSDSLSSDLVSESNDLTQKSGQQDSQQENISTDISEVVGEVDKDQEMKHVDFKALHEKSLKEIQSGVESNQPVNQDNEALDSKEISELAKESASTAPELEPKTTSADDGGIKTDISTAKSAVEGILSDAERMLVQVEMSSENETEPTLIIYAPGGDVAKVQDNIKGMDYAARNANDGIHLQEVLLQGVEVSSDKSSNIKIEVRDLDKSQEKDPESSTEGKIIHIAPSGTVTLGSTKDQSPIESMISEERMDVAKQKSEKESGEVVKVGSGIKTETSTAKSDAEPSLTVYTPGEDAGNVQHHLKRFGQAGGPTQVDVVDTEQVSLENAIVDSSDKSSDKKMEVRDLDKSQEKVPESSTEGKIIYIAPSGTVTLGSTKDQSPIESMISEERVDVAKQKSEKESGEVVKDGSGIKIAKSDAKPSLTVYTPGEDAGNVQHHLKRFGQAGGPTQVDVVSTEQVSPENAIVDSSDKSSDNKIEDKSQEKDQNLSAEGHISLASPPAKVALHTVKDHSQIESMIAGGNLNVNRAKPRSGAGIEEIISDDGGRKAESSTGSTPIYSIRDESEDASNWKEVIIADSKHLVDMKAVEPYKKCVAHGGYYGNGLNAIIVLSACHLPPKNIPNYTYVMDNLFYYIMNVLEVMAVDQYKLVYLHGTMTEAKLPPNKWMKKCYETIDRKLKKRMEQMLVVHPTFWLKTLIFLFASSKFSKKLVYMKSLADLRKLFPSEDLQIPEEVVEVDHKLNPPKKRSK